MRFSSPKKNWLLLRSFFCTLFTVALLFSLLIPPAAVQGVDTTAEPGSYIIVFKTPPGSEEVELVRKLGGDIRYVYDIIPGIAASLPEGAIEILATNPRVNYIHPDVEVHALGQVTPWGITRVRAPEVWHATQGEDIKVAVLDTGIDYTHPELAANYGGGWNFVDKSEENPDGTDDPMDDNGHGTHVAGTIAAVDNATGVVGAAPAVRLYALKVLPGTTADIIAAIDWSVTNEMDIINMSLGYSSPFQVTRQACDNAYEAGLLVVAAAGNDGNAKGTGDNVSQPAKYESVIAVAAIDRNEVRAPFSSTGSDVELSAPGVDILSAVPDATQGGRVTAGGITYESRALLYSGYGSVSGPLVDCGLQGNPLETPPAGDWIAMIERGTYTFAEKVQNAMNAGAAAAIIANNDQNNPDDPGSFTLGEGDWVPALSISYNNGNAIRGEPEGTVTVEDWPYDFFNGTSMASPHVAGVAALLWKYNPALTNKQLRQHLQNTARTLGDSKWYGYGLVDALAAVDPSSSFTGYEITVVSLNLGDVLAGKNTWPEDMAKNRPITVSAEGSWQVTAVADGDFSGGNPAVLLDIGSLKMGRSYETVVSISREDAVIIAEGTAGTGHIPNVHTTLDLPWDRDDLVGKQFSVTITYTVLPQ